MIKRKWILSGAIALVLVLAIITVIASTAPGNFPIGASVLIPKGQTLTEAADLLVEKGIIRSGFLFKVYATILEKTTGIRTGDYLFANEESALRVAYRLVKGQEGYPMVKITIPEGIDSRTIANIIVKAIPGFSKDEFLASAKRNEGRLFPETYFWPTNVTPDKVISDMRAQFNTKIATIKASMDEFGKDGDDVLKMASIVEKEATSSVDRRIVAGILWKRLDVNMALQVDPPFEYFLNKTSNKLTLDDLQVNSPYNLYLHTGLPPTAIDNPGLDAILDTINPAKSTYWYYLSGKDGAMHYAKTLDGHLANKYKYLD